ncbi:acyltransferase family protein, partial [Clostridioides difficile]
NSNSNSNKISNNAVDSKLMNSRIKSIDIIRGLSIALMIVCNNPGTWMRMYPQLRHAVWHGVTLADFAFPFFVISLGVTISISINSKLKNNKSTLSIILSIFKRSILLILFGFFLNYLGNPDLDTVRILGVLQRMGLVYFVTSLVYLLLKKLNVGSTATIITFLCISTFIIVGYYILAKPYGFELEGSLAQLVDLHFFKGHLYKPEFEPDGFLTSIVAISSGMLGCTMGCVLLKEDIGEYKKFFKILVMSIILLIGAFIFNQYFPFNKRLWSSSFVLLMAGSYGILLSIFYFICDIKNKSKIFTPIIALGSSPIFTYMCLEILSHVFWNVPKLTNKVDYPTTLVEWTTYELITPWAGTTWDSLIFSLLYVLFWVIVMSIMYKKKIFIKI